MRDEITPPATRLGGQPSTIVRSLAKVLGVFAAQAAAEVVAYHILNHAPAVATTFWLPAGIATALTFIFGWRYWPALLTGCFVGAVISGNPFLAIMPSAIGTTCSAVIGQLLVSWINHGEFRFDKVRNLWVWLICAAGVGPVISALIGSFALLLEGLVSFDKLLSVVSTWVVGDATAIIGFSAPLMIICDDEVKPVLVKPWTKYLSLLGFLAASFLFAFPSLLFVPTAVVHDRPYLIIPAIIFLAIGYGLFWSAFCSLCAAMVAVIAYSDNLGQLGSSWGSNEAQFFLSAVSISAFVAAILTNEKGRAEKATDEIAALSDQTIAAMMDGILIYSKDGILIKANDAIESLLGIPRSAILGSSISSAGWILFDEDGAPIETKDRPSVVAFTTQKAVVPKLYRGLSAKREAWVELSASPVFDSSGALSAIVTISRDVTEVVAMRRRAERNLSKFRVVADDLPVFVYMTDHTGQSIYMNKHWERFIEECNPAAAGSNWHLLIEDRDREVVLAREDAAFARREIYREQYRLKRSDGASVWFKDIGAPRFDAEGIFLGYIGCMMPMDESAMLGERYAAISELATSWRAAREVFAGAAEELDWILSRVNVMNPMEIGAISASIVEVRSRLAEVARIADEDDEKSPTSVVTNGVDAAITRARRLFGSNWNIQTKISTNAEVNLSLTQMRQVITNLLMNAKEALIAGGEISIEVNELGDRELRLGTIGGSGWVRIEVKDNGVGISSEDIPHAAKPFWSRKAGRVGLGLTLVKDLVSRAGGYLNIESRIGHGTSIRILLPIVRGPDVAEIEPLPIGNSEQIYVHLGDEKLEAMLGEQLVSLGYQPILASRMVGKSLPKIDLMIAEPLSFGHESGQPSQVRGCPSIWVSSADRMDFEKHGIVSRDDIYIRMPYSIREIAESVRDGLARELTTVWSYAQEKPHLSNV